MTNKPDNQPKRPYGEGKPKCGAARTSAPDGATCRRPAGWGTDHAGTGRCKRHGGSTSTHVVAAQKVQAAEVLARYSVPRTVDPRDGLIEEYYRSAGIVAFLERMVNAIDPGDLAWGVVEETEQVGTVTGDEDANSRPGTKTKHRAVPNVWVTMFNAERDRFAKLGLEIVKLGLEERRDAARERHANQLIAAARLWALELGLTAEQQARFPAAVASASAMLRAVEGRVVAP